jgi:hypothetical protein
MRTSITNSTKRQIDAFDQMNSSRVETVGTGRCADLPPRTTQGHARQRKVERAMGIEPTAQAWEAWVLPLYDARLRHLILVVLPWIRQMRRPKKKGARKAPF